MHLHICWFIPGVVVFVAAVGSCNKQRSSREIKAITSTILSCKIAYWVLINNSPINRRVRINPEVMYTCTCIYRYSAQLPCVVVSDTVVVVMVDVVVEICVVRTRQKETLSNCNV